MLITCIVIMSHADHLHCHNVLIPQGIELAKQALEDLSTVENVGPGAGAAELVAAGQEHHSSMAAALAREEEDYGEEEEEEPLYTRPVSLQYILPTGHSEVSRTILSGSVSVTLLVK